MSWRPIVNSSTADASDVNSNFNFVAGGSRLPRTSAGASFAPTDSAYDMGSSVARWDTGHVNNLDIDGSVTTADKSLWILLAETTLLDTATSVEFTGLNGDDEIEYMINIYVIGATGSPNPPVRIVMSGISGSSYSHQYLFGTASSAAASRSPSASAYWSCTSAPGFTSGNILTMYKGVIYAKTGNERTMIGHGIGGAKGTYVHRVVSVAAILDDTSTTITSLKVMGNKFGAGSNIMLWGRK